MHIRKKPIVFDEVADIYDRYVRVDFDIPFFLRETEGYDGEILELMCGTGRVSIPLLEADRRLVCVDHSPGMLKRFREKIAGTQFKVRMIMADAAHMELDERFGMVILPFHSLSEILTLRKQAMALQNIARHMIPGGEFICTLRNPVSQLRTVDGTMRTLGRYPADDGTTMIVSAINTYDKKSGIVSGTQYYEFYNDSNERIESRNLSIHYRPTTYEEFVGMAQETGYEITVVYGDYSGSAFREDSSDFIIFKLQKK